MVRFIDWLSVVQEHPDGGLPIVGKEMVTRYDLQTGEIVRASPNSKLLEGSHSTYLLVRCDGSRVSVEGNPSRWQRLDNLFGLQTFDQCIHVYNQILEELGLPIFTKCTKLGWEQGPEGQTAKRITDGALITRVDFTRNLAVGKGNTLPFLRALSSQSIGKGKTPYLYPNGRTVDWGKGSTYWYQKVYEKAEDLKRSLAKLSKTGNLPEEEKRYLEKLISHCENEGIIREEREFKSKFLRRNKLCYYGMTEEKDFDKHLNDIEKMIGRLEMSASDYETIADQLLNRGIVKSRQAATATQSYHMAWLHGQPFPGSRSQFYVHRGRLLQLGIDISIQHDVSKAFPQIKRTREINVATALPPAWYRMPKVTKIDLVA